MKKKFLLAILMAISFVTAHAQFVLTPSDGLVYAHGTYTIDRESTVEDNLQAVSSAINNVISNAVIEHVTDSCTISVSAPAIIKMGKSGARSFDHKGEYTLEIEASSKTIIIRFVKLSQFEHVLGSVIIPWKPNEKTILNVFVFKNDGTVRHKKAKEAIENWANSLVQEIAQSIKKA